MARTWLGQSSNSRKTVQGSVVVREWVRASRIETAMAEGSAVARERVRADRIVTAVATGALLGALAAMPYDQLLGISGPACMILRSVLTTAVWAGLRGEQPRDLNFSAVPSEAGAPDWRAAQRGQESPIRGVGAQKGNHWRFKNVLKIRAESIRAHDGG